LRIKFGYEDRIVSKVIYEILKFAIIKIPHRTIDIIKSKDDDNRILELAVAVGADYLVTGDKKHILPLGEFNKTKILIPHDFLYSVLSKFEQ